MPLKRISEFIRELPAFRRGQVHNHRDAIELSASTMHHQQITVDWAHPRGAPLVAEVNHGRWIVECPYCNGASMAEEGEVFFCPDCLMIENGGFPRPVRFPHNASEIEATLLERPDENKRNWKVFESVDVLKAENDYYLKGGNK